MDPATLALIIQMILDLIAACQEKRDQAEIRADLRAPKLRIFIAYRRVLKKNTALRGRELGEAAREGIEELVALEDDELDSLMEDANDIHLARVAALAAPGA